MPRWTWLPFALGLTFLVVPLAGMLARVPWAELPALLVSHEAVEALGLSLLTCVVATAVSLVLGVPLALAMSRMTGRTAVVVRTLVTIPMVLPPVVAGLALLSTLGRRGLVGQHLSAWGIEIGFTTVAVVCAQVFVAMPFLVIALEGALRADSGDYGTVAANLGASPTRVLWRVTLPMSMPALVSGAALTFARALGEFGATLTFAGSLAGTTRTLPLLVYLTREQDTDLALALALVLVLVALVVVAVSARFNRPVST
ncbi:molybdate ABC transporter permease subunit [Tessaracoccus rhinocerotis]|uniref:Molybdenum transport system permease n=1 Tax=Tessaracoccus rhinocerotis TaxID=1689449 RepID=A0A553JWQ7_9ACTN|nr:ABC transporter permease [Tessaracoccus rhinocerotis]TRY16888.1 molybdate ABC transporter permease subunit [Tessaracoccus rhinocerotis]